jgi:hypothetical protein
VVQSRNFVADTPYRDEFPFIVLFWVGFVAACVFAYSCFTRTLSKQRAMLLGALLALGVVGGIMEEIGSIHDTKTSFPLGFFELAPLSWAAAGMISRLWPNKWFQPTSLPRRDWTTALCIQAMAHLDRSVASLRISGDDLDPSEITKALDCEPTRGQRKGDVLIGKSTGISRTVKFGMWLLEANDREPEDLDGQITGLLDRLNPSLDIWRSIAARYRIDLFCGLFMRESNEGAAISAASLAALGQRGALRTVSGLQVCRFAGLQVCRFAGFNFVIRDAYGPQLRQRSWRPRRQGPGWYRRRIVE